MTERFSMHLFKEIVIEKLTSSEIDKIKEELFAFVENNDDFFSTCELGTTEEAVQDLFYDVPPIAANAVKRLFGLYEGKKLIGFIDSLIKYPDNETSYIGVLAIDRHFRSQGIGKYFYECFEHVIAKEGYKKIRLAVHEENAGAIRFWQRLGFVQVNDFEYRCGTLRKRAEFEKKVKESENDSRFSEYTKTED
ncbi:MAG TPA: GNAT family N-acetyltransferase [bacterium]|nr:GNAT family N-acetyltransferase [bacterium]HQJ60644.1 GNAT family N-acetyltransferase [bacterium]